MPTLDGLRAVVTGGANGIGLAITRAFIEAGASVGVLDRDTSGLDAEFPGIENGKLVKLDCDVSDRAKVSDVINAFAVQGGIDILVNNAVVFHYAPLVEFPEDEIHRMLDIGIKGVFWATQAATPFLEKSRNGSVVNLSSMAVSIAVSRTSVYTTIKGAIDALTRQQAAELGAKGVRVNAVAPGSVRTPGASAVITDAGWAQREAKSLLGRLPEAKDVAKSVVFLASEDASCITGVSLKIDCGMSIAGA
jgi:NAD(P)-dependent dehydrogenase (short-subunit alcohol dehydrogenase family)